MAGSTSACAPSQPRSRVSAPGCEGNFVRWLGECTQAGKDRGNSLNRLCESKVVGLVIVHHVVAMPDSRHVKHRCSPQDRQPGFWLHARSHPSCKQAQLTQCSSSCCCLGVTCCDVLGHTLFCMVSDTGPMERAMPGTCRR